MLLSVLERMLLDQVLPREGSIINLKLLREVREGLSFTEEENKLLNIKQDGEQVRWNDVVVDKKTGKPVEGTPEFIQKRYDKNPDDFLREPAVGDTEIPIGDNITAVIVKALEELDKAEKLTEGHISLYEKFIT